MSKQNLHTIFEHSDCLSEQQLIAYSNNQLSNLERNEVERHTINCKFCSDALEGFEKHENSVDGYLLAKSKIGESPKSYKSLIISITGIAAAIIIGLFLFESDPTFDDIKTAEHTTEEFKKANDLKRESKASPEEVEEVIVDTAVATSDSIAAITLNVADEYPTDSASYKLSTEKEFIKESDPQPNKALTYSNEPAEEIAIEEVYEEDEEDVSSYDMEVVTIEATEEEESKKSEERDDQRFEEERKAAEESEKVLRERLAQTERKQQEAERAKKRVVKEQTDKISKAEIAKEDLAGQIANEEKTKETVRKKSEVTITLNNRKETELKETIVKKDQIKLISEENQQQILDSTITGANDDVESGDLSIGISDETENTGEEGLELDLEFEESSDNLANSPSDLSLDKNNDIVVASKAKAPVPSDTLMARGLTQFDNKQYKLAIATLTQIFKGQSEFHKAQLHIGKSFVMLGKNAEAKKYLTEALNGDAKIKAEAQAILDSIK